jgi:hypothetical protein
LNIIRVAWIASLEVNPANSDAFIFVREPKNCRARLAMSRLAVIYSLHTRLVDVEDRSMKHDLVCTLNLAIHSLTNKNVARGHAIFVVGRLAA